ncbi:MAG: tetratricopeptide repeat protein, partial [Anaerolineales bacterium]|nr:tetratricopeptide repeat protein [Anaerolineales bacterium]
IGDIKGKAASLSMMADIFLTTRNLSQAKTLLEQALALSQQLGDIQGIAFVTVKLGQLAQAQGKLAEARQQYEAGLAIFRRLGMPRETAQVEQMLASLAGGPAAPASPEEVRQNLVGQVGTALVAYRQGQLSPSQAHDVAGQAATVAAQVASDEALGELRHELAVFLQAAAQVLRGQDWPPLPEAYASVVAQIEEAAGLPPDAAEAPQAPAGVENAEDTEEAEALSAADRRCWNK